MWAAEIPRFWLLYNLKKHFQISTGVQNKKIKDCRRIWLTTQDCVSTLFQEKLDHV